MEYDRAAIIKRVAEQENHLTLLHARQDRDFDRWRLKEYEPPDVLQGFHIRTDSEPRSFADKIIAIATEAKVLPRIPGDTRQKQQRLIDSEKERGGAGWLREADRRLERRWEKKLQTTMAWQGAVRGWISVRASMMKRLDGTTYTDIRGWDMPRLTWEMGDEGPLWVCHHLQRQASTLSIMHDIPVLGDQRGIADFYDYYDTRNNYSFTSNEDLKPPTPHGGDRPPVILVPVGPQPLIYQNDDIASAMETYGESIFHSVRGDYDDINFITSCMMELVARSIRQAVLVFSEGGDKTLKQNPFETGTEISLKTGKENVLPAGLEQMAQDTGMLMAHIVAARQRGSLPHSAYGEVPFQLSGYAINSLRQGILTIIRWVLEAMQTAYNLILDNLSTQYASGFFAPMQVAAFDKRKRFFSSQLPIEVVRQGGDFEVKLVADLPQDDPGKLQMARLAREGPWPIYPDEDIHEKILLTEDFDLLQDKIREQLGERAFPTVSAYKLMASADARGEKIQAAMISTQLRLEVAKQRLQLFQLQQAEAMMMAGIPGGPGTGGGNLPDFGGNGKGQEPGFSPDVSPNSAQGAPPPEPAPQQGALVPGGSRRPGASRRNAQKRNQPETGQEG